MYINMLNIHIVYIYVYIIYLSAFLLENLLQVSLLLDVNYLKSSRSLYPPERNFPNTVTQQPFKVTG